MTGPRSSSFRGTGFDPIFEKTPTLVSTLKSAGYFTGVAHKIAHMQPLSRFPWDYIRTGSDRRTTEYGNAVAEAIAQAGTAEKAWFFFVDSYLCLGSGITLGDDTAHSVATDLNQSLLLGPVFTSKSVHPISRSRK